MSSKLHIPVGDNLDKLTDDELNHYLSVWKKEYEKTRSQADTADQKYNDLLEEHFNRKRNKIHWGNE